MMMIMIMMIDDDDCRRGCDMEGSWRTVACTGAEAHGAALGMSGAVLEGYLEQVIIMRIIMIIMILIITTVCSI